MSPCAMYPSLVHDPPQVKRNARGLPKSLDQRPRLWQRLQQEECAGYLTFFKVFWYHWLLVIAGCMQMHTYTHVIHTHTYRVLFDLPLWYSVSTHLFSFRNVSTNEVPERWICSIADGFWQECQEIGDDIPLKSSGLLQAFSRASQTGHESQSRAVYEQLGLKLRVPVSSLDIGIDQNVPYIKASDLIKVMSLNSKVEECLLGGEGLDVLPQFWKRFRRVCPSHQFFSDGKRFESSIPVAFHADEGQCVKKEQILIFNFQGVIGRGTCLAQSKGSVSFEQGLNFQGNSFSTRFLLTTLVAKHFRKKNKEKDTLIRLVDAVVDDFLTLYTDGLEIQLNGQWRTIYIVPLAFKGDWPMLSKIGNFTQHFLRRGRPTRDSCICHLCKAGSEGYPYHDCSISAKWYETYLKERPWNRAPPLVRLPMPPQPESFFQFDIFHVIHKGVGAEFTGSALAPYFEKTNFDFFTPWNRAYNMSMFVLAPCSDM